MRFVEIKSAARLDMPSLHRARERLVAERNAFINHVQAVLLERGIALPQGRRNLKKRLPGILAATVAGILSGVDTLRGLASPARFH